MNIIFTQILLASVISAGFVYLCIPTLRKIAYQKHLYDSVENDRKLHSKYISPLGGVSLFIAVFIGFSISGMGDAMTGYPYFSAALLILFFTGLKDDLVGISPVKKIIIQVLTGLLIIIGSEIYIDNFQGVFGVFELPYLVSLSITLFTMIVVVNAYNLIDGVDGLAGSIGLVSCIFLGAGFYIAGNLVLMAMALITGMSLIGFLVHNYSPASIFMGDSGSLVVGLLLTVMSIKFIGLNESASYLEAFGYSSALLPVAILIIPLYDTIRIFSLRITRGHSPFHADNDHIHHELLKEGMGHTGVTLYLSGVGIVIALGTILMTRSGLDLNIVLAAIISTAFILLPTNGYKRRILSHIDLVKIISSFVKPWTMGIKEIPKKDSEPGTKQVSGSIVEYNRSEVGKRKRSTQKAEQE